VSSNSVQHSYAIAGPGLEAADGRWVKVDAQGIATLVTSDTDEGVAGILHNGAAEGESVTIGYAGLESKFTVGAIIEPWNFVTSDSQGRVIPVTTDSQVKMGRYVPDFMAVDGVETTLATGQAWGVYIIVGRGGSSSAPRPTNGFADYNDASTSGTPIALVADTWTTIPNDGAGAFTNLAYLPSGVTALMDTSTGAIDVSELSLGDVVLIRNDYTVTPATNNASLSFRYQLGTGGGSYTLEKRVGRLDEGSGIGYRQSLNVDKIYMGDANTRDNPIVLQVKLSTTGTLVNAGSAISVVRHG